ncbi:MAG TPA: hypothetical protein VHR66_23950 [Gemmataceae bacterium]|jgi:hypothetical protein|nr:hypothetical protein [Gemmataceae bacterium]
MSNTQDTIGLTQLLDEIDSDLADFRKKHPTDFGVKTTSMWWELERERLKVRHGSGVALTRVWSLKRLVRIICRVLVG